jgi:hypothetical protein
MNLQKKVIGNYLGLSNRPTLKQISLETKIQQTRVFRILNGSEMKLYEYEIFKKLILKKMNMEGSLEDLSIECTEKLTEKAILEIKNLMERKLHWSILKNSSTKISQKKLA